MRGMSRAASTLLGAGVAGFLLWLAAQLGRHTTGSYWAAYGIVAGAGLVVGMSQLRGRDGHPPATFTMAFLPVLIVAGWVLLAMQPDGNWFRGHVLAWSGDIHVRGIVEDLGTSAADLLEMCAHEGTLPIDVLVAVCEKAGCGDTFDDLRA